MCVSLSFFLKIEHGGMGKIVGGKWCGKAEKVVTLGANWRRMAASEPPFCQCESRVDLHGDAASRQANGAEKQDKWEQEAAEK